MEKPVTLEAALKRIDELEKENADLREKLEYYRNRKLSGRQKHNAKNFTLNMGRDSNIKYKPYVFTEQGVSKYAPIIATLLKNPTLILPQ